MNKELKQIKNLWEEEYRDWNNKYNHDFHNIHLNDFKKYIYGQVIDIGCGPGRNIKFLNSCSGVRGVLGVDIANNAIKQAKNRVKELKNVNLLCASLLDIEGQFDFFYDSSCYVHCDKETKKSYINWVKNNANNRAKILIVYPEWINLWDIDDETKFNNNFSLIKTIVTNTSYGNLIAKLFILEN